MCGEMLGVGVDGEAYGLENDYKKKFWDHVKTCDIILDIQHNRRDGGVEFFGVEFWRF